MIKKFFAGALLAGCSAVAAYTVAFAQDDVEDQIDALLSEMTLEEKVGQLTQYSSFWDATGPAPQGGEQEEKFEQVREGRVGSMLNVVGREEVRAVQELAVEDSRLGIPLIFGYDVVHGHKTIFPIPLAESASWDLGLMEQSARVAAIEAAAQGLNWTFAPMVDISRDPRWGRVMEGAGEDPYLGARIAVARVKGFQGDDLSADDTIAATIKHLAGYGFSEGGRDYNTVDVGTVTLHNIILPPFKAAVEEADVRTAMNSFNTLNGVPATGDAHLQRDLLKEAWGFDGFIVSDWASGREMIDHGYAAGPRDAARLAIEAGSDMDMESYVYRDHLAELVESGDVGVALVDDAVRRVLRVKHDLGLFEDPYRYVDDPAQEDILMSAEHRAVALEVAKNSIVLLKNEGSMLPIRQGEKIALIGALAADKDTPLGNWRAAGETGTAVSVVEGFEAAGIDFTYREGAAVEVGQAGFPQPVVVNTTDRSGFDAALAAARKADKVVLVLGEDGLQSGEGRSRSDIGLPGVQQELLEAVQAANPDTVLVVMSGRPLILDWADANVPAIVQAWHLGHESGHAIASVLTGEHNPSGKLPMSFPRSVGQIPVYYNYLNTGRPGPLENEVFWSHYNDLPNTPLYSFGHGLSYTGFAYSDIEVTPSDDAVTVSVMLKNTGKVAGTEVAQLYLRDPVASVARPVRELKGFSKVMLEPGESTQVTFSLTSADLGFYDPYGNFKVESGDFEVYVGGSSKADLGATFTWAAN